MISSKMVVVARLAIAAVLVAAWQFTSGRLVDAVLIGSPMEVVRVLWRWCNDGTLPNHWLVTMHEMVLGFLLGFIVGGVLGAVMGAFRIAEALFEPYVFFLYSVPRIALAPLFIVWFGIAAMFKIMFVAFMVLFVALITMFYSMRDIDPAMIHAVRIMGGSKRQILQKVVFPQMLLWMFASLKLTLPYALVGTIVAEFLASNAGLGFIIFNASSILDTNAVLAGVFVLALTGTALNVMISRIERRMMHWKKGAAGALAA